LCKRPASRSRVRPQGLATLSTLCSLRRLAGYVSHRQRSWDSPFEAFSSRKASGGFPPEEPTYRFCRSRKSARRQSGQASDPQFLGRAPFASPWRSSPCLAGQSLDAPLGFALSGPADRSLAGISPELLSRAWRTRTAPARPAPQSIDQLLLGLAEPPRRTETNSQTTLVEFLRL